MERPYHFTHYHPETKTLLEVGACENCGNPVQEPNACEYLSYEGQQAKLESLGFRKLEGKLPPETFHCDELESSACYGCK